LESHAWQICIHVVHATVESGHTRSHPDIQFFIQHITRERLQENTADCSHSQVCPASQQEQPESESDACAVTNPEDILICTTNTQPTQNQSTLICASEMEAGLCLTGKRMKRSTSHDIRKFHVRKCLRDYACTTSHGLRKFCTRVFVYVCTHTHTHTLTRNN
jgi:hypothetical protein